jgi:hypothetical protein
MRSIPHRVCAPCGQVLGVHLVRPGVRVPIDARLLDLDLAVGGGEHVDDLHVVLAVGSYVGS